ncbi:Ribonuclease BN [Saezia sanguinis]|uniref:Ribonuclease Z n=1 Tax=Saezia sanguinis TaxID=1965230 RepID=A0A433SBI0_9BURK|nr:ribonuclease Z [Saezia sanguinis]RUS66083.1 Ribonuclease BN [Saezia sanguinis]
MELQFLGTSAGVPTLRRNVTSIALNLLKEQQGIWLFDCGEGTQHQIMRSGLNPQKIEQIFITHMHGDHILGLPGLLTSRSMSTGPQPLTVYGPPGIRRYLETVLEMTASYLTYPLTINEIQPGAIMQQPQFTVHAAHLEHRVECFGYRIEQSALPGALDAGKLQRDNISSGPHLQQLKNGQTITLPDGRIINGQDYIHPATPGKIITIMGDTAPAPQAVALARHADILVHEATLEAAFAEKANERGHATTTQAAQFAKDSQAKQLIITHISARYHQMDEPRLLEECRAIFPATVMAHDLETFPVN